ncbi:hypothetical protein ASE73_02740 [Sphingomonas sp. Leaf24]|uniref:sialate O-acetylesterase n=1 Tax=unclassified Sphingomonas TaxID=196159 RepID=UPI0006FC6A37|nr:MULTISPECIES: sialate O-acetylesterase [unclassified Sphingomonas]KQM23159.1 hypothetical protein ASE50_02740 [Sphingomonas sp. Leaf5]KQM96017.1 hypothetical protein ASE73_02740 [Sphingomonas sp. Leaf24]
MAAFSLTARTPGAMTAPAIARALLSRGKTDAEVRAAISQASDLVTGLDSILSLPRPVVRTAHIILSIGQSNGPGRERYDPAIDTEQANIIQFCDIRTRTSTYQTLRASVFPLYFPENKISEGYVSPINYAAKAVAATLPADDVVCIVPANVGATSLLSASAYGWSDAPHWSVGRVLQLNAISQTKAAINALVAAGYRVVIHSIIDAQGEADNRDVSAADYRAAKIAQMFDLRGQIPGADDARIVLSGFVPERLKTLATLQDIEDARKSAVAALTNAVFVRGPSGYLLNDGMDVHYNAAGSRVLGRNIGMALTGIALPPMVTFVSDVTVAEGTGAAGATTLVKLPVYRSDYGDAVSIPVDVVLGSFTADDFSNGAVPTNLVAAFAAGSDSTTVTVPIAADTIAEGAESFALALRAAAGYLVGAKGSANVIVSNDDSGGAPVWLSTSFDVPNGTALTAHTTPSGHAFSGGTHIINERGAYSTGSSTSLPICDWIPPGGAYGVRVPFNFKTTPGGQFVVWRVKDASNYYFAGKESGGSKWGSFKMVNGSPFRIATDVQPPDGLVAGTLATLEVRHAADGTLTVTVDGYSILRKTVDGQITNDPVIDNTFTAGGVGLRQSGAMGATAGTHVKGIETFAL